MLLALLICSLVPTASAIPKQDQILLANSLIVGKNDFTDLLDWKCKVCESLNKPIRTHRIENNKLDVKCIVSVYSDMIVLAFRYTSTALNVWQDILYPIQISDANTCSKCKVQKVYNRMWEAVKEQVIADLKQTKQQTDINSLFITGISLGGGLAAISYIDIEDLKLFNTIQVTTFGAPRVGNKQWAAHFDLLTNAAAKRYVISTDPIAAMPRCLTLLCNYRQAGVKLVCYKDRNICIEEEQILEESRFFLNARSQSRKRELKSIADHIHGYPLIYNMDLQVK